MNNPYENSPERFRTPEQLKKLEEERLAKEIPKVETMPQPVSDVEVIKIDSEQVGQYGETVEAYIEQSTNISDDSETKIKNFAQSINLPSESASSAKVEHNIDTQLSKIQGEADHISKEAREEISAIITENPLESLPKLETSLSWNQVFETSSGKEFSDAMRGVVDGKQDVTHRTITHDYSVREFVRKHPKEAQQFSDTYQKEFGKPHPYLSQATEQIEGLQRKPPEIPPEDSKYAELSYRIDNDPEYLKLREDSSIAHKMSLFGTTNFKNIPLDRFMELCNTDANLTFSSDREAEKEFRKKFGEKSALYDEREKTRVYRDPDGIINRDRDPLFLKMFDSDSRGIGLMPDEALRQFAIRYPEKARGYSEKYSDMQTYIRDAEQSQRQERKPTPLEKNRLIPTFEIQKVVSKEEVANKISEQLKTTKESGVAFDQTALQERKDKLTERLVIDAKAFDEATISLEEPQFDWAEIDKIVGRPFGEQNPGGWSFEYDNRRGRMVEIAKELASEDKDKIEHIFHPDKPNERIKLIAIDGPSGPMYSVEDGTHRVGGAMTARLKEIPCDIKRIHYPFERVATSDDDAYGWAMKMKLGLIQGYVETLQNKDGKKSYKFTVQKEVLPWIRTPQRELLKISRAYEKLYPGSLENLSVPRDALIDPIANNYFMTGRWSEWLERFSKNKRDENSIVIYR